MTLEDVIGQGRVKEILSAAVRSDRLPHALLFHGPEGVGKDAMALELAKHINCSHPPCHTCPSCLKISRGQHPDVLLVLPVPSSLKPDEIGSLIQEKSQQPYGTIAFTKPSSISIKAVRELQKILSYAPFEGKRKVAILSDADKMTLDAANAFLKTLEEPPPETLIILTTAKIHALLQTVLSRCQKLRFDPLSDEEIEKALIDHLHAAPLTARLASRLAIGNYGMAREFIEEDISTRRQEALDVLKSGASGGPAQAIEMTESLLHRFNIDELKSVLNLSLLWLRDLLSLSENRDAKAIANIDRLDELNEWSRTYPPSEIHKWIEGIKETLNLIDRNVNQQLALTNLMLSFRTREHKVIEKSPRRKEI